MKTYVVPVTKVSRTDLSLIQDALPKDYGVAIGSGGVYSIKSLNYGVICALATIKNEQACFSFFEEGYAGFLAEEFRQALAKKYPTEDPNREVWQVFKPCQGGFTYLGPRWYEGMEDAFANAFQFERPDGAYLCSFKVGDFLSGEPFRTLSSHRLTVDEDMIQSGKDEGPKLINLKSSEAGVARK